MRDRKLSDLMIGAATFACLAFLIAFAPSNAQSSTESPSTGQVTAQQQDDGTVGLEVLLPSDALFTPDGRPTVEVVIDGDPVDSRVAQIQGVVNRDRILLLVDGSGSMEGARLRQVRQAVGDVLESLDPSILFGLGTFADDFQLLVPPTDDRQVIDESLATVNGEGDTALFDALTTVLSLGVAERVIVLTDGADTVSSVAAEDVLRQVSATRIPIDVIALQILGDPAESLGRVVEESGGEFISKPADLSQSLKASTVRVDPVVRVSTDVPWTDDLDGQRVDVRIVDATGRIFEANATLRIASPGPAVEEQAVIAGTPQWTPYALALLAFAAVGAGSLAAIQLLRANRSRGRIKRVLAHYTTNDPSSEGSSHRRAEHRDTTAARPIPRRWREAIELQSENAALPFSPMNWLLIQIAAMAATFALLLIVGLPVAISALGGLLALVVMQAIVRSRIESFRRQFDSELADFFTLVASGLRSGLSLTQAVAGAAHGGSDVLARQMRRVTAEVALGLDLADALEAVARRMSSNDLALAVQAVRIQRESGGSLSHILDIAAITVRQRGQLQREVRALSAEGRISAIVLMLLPLAVFAFFFVTRRDYVEVFWTEPAGWVMLGALVVILGIGTFWMQRMTKIDI